MSKRKAIDKEDARERRDHLLQSAAAAELGLNEGVRQMRAVTGMTQEEFAHHRGVSARVIKEIERNRANPTVATLNRIGELFGLEVAFVPKRREATVAQQPGLAHLSKNSEVGTNQMSPPGFFSNTGDAMFFSKEQHHQLPQHVENWWYHEFNHQRDALTWPHELAKTLKTFQQQLSQAEVLSEKLKNVDVLIKKLENSENLIVQLKQVDSWVDVVKKAESLTRNLPEAELLSSRLEDIENLNQKFVGVERKIDQLNDWKALLDHSQKLSQKKK